MPDAFCSWSSNPYALAMMLVRSDHQSPRKRTVATSSFESAAVGQQVVYNLACEAITWI